MLLEVSDTKREHPDLYHWDADCFEAEPGVKLRFNGQEVSWEKADLLAPFLYGQKPRAGFCCFDFVNYLARKYDDSDGNCVDCRYQLSLVTRWINKKHRLRFEFAPNSYLLLKNTKTDQPVHALVHIRDGLCVSVAGDNGPIVFSDLFGISRMYADHEKEDLDLYVMRPK